MSSFFICLIYFCFRRRLIVFLFYIHIVCIFCFHNRFIKALMDEINIFRQKLYYIQSSYFNVHIILSQQIERKRKSMLKYLINHEYREAYKFLSQNKFMSLDFKFRDIGFQKIRNNIQLCQVKKQLSFFISCFKILAEEKKKPNSKIKILMFINFILQTQQKKNQEMLQLLSSQLNDLLQDLHVQSMKKQQKVQGIVLSTETNQNFPEDKVEKLHSLKLNKSSLFSFTQNTFGSDRSNPQAQILGQNFGSIDKNYQVTSSIEVLNQMYVKPYATYLQKKCAISNTDQQMLDNYVIMWRQVNMLKLLLKISDGISVITRYYRNQYMDVTLNIIEILHTDIQKSYTSLTQKVRYNIKLINKQYENKIYIQRLRKLIENQQNNCYNEYIESISSFTQNHSKQLTQIKQLLKQISQINEKFYYVYKPKTLYHKLIDIKIYMPVLMHPQNKQFENIFTIVAEKQKMMNREARKQRLRRTKSGNLLKLIDQYKEEKGQIQKKQKLRAEKLSSLREPNISSIINQCPNNIKISQRLDRTKSQTKFQK